MKKEIRQSQRELVWINILFFAVTTLVAVVGTPLYLRHFGLSAGEAGLFLFYIAATALSITVGYHRLFAHRTFKAHPIVEFFVLFFGAAAFEQPALRWASQHRDHHRYVDTDRDPYSIKKGFFYAHIGWLMFWRHPVNLENARDLQRKKMLAHQDRHYYAWSVVSGILLPLGIGFATAHLLGAFILTVCLRITFVYHSTFCINSVCHMFGKATYDIYSTAKDHWFVALLTFGEGYHNFHHRFPGDYRNAVRWYQWDPSKWCIYLLQFLGLTRDLKRVSKFRILEARLAAQSQTARDLIVAKLAGHQKETLHQQLDRYYGDLRSRLFAWEQAAQSYRAVVCREMSDRSKRLRTAAFIRLERSKKRFAASRAEWHAFQLNHFGLVV